MSTLNPQAVELNNTIKSVNPAVYEMLSNKGKGIFFPAKGILGQAAAAKGKKINATIGIALEDNGEPLGLDCVKDLFDIDAKNSLPYAPSFGKPELRQVWKDMMFEKNPSLEGKQVSQPVVSQALTHALSMCGYLFLDPGDEIILPELFWGNYRLSFVHAYDAQIKTFTTFTDDNAFNIDGLKESILEGGPGKKVVLLNFPNNPAGYTVTESELTELTAMLIDCAEAGHQLVTLIDDAYFGLVYEEGIAKESIFASLVDAHDNILAVKIDGATKEDYVWGLRVGFITYGNKAANADFYKALESKTAGAIRGNISNCSHLSQSIMLKAFTHPDYQSQKQEKYDLLKRRVDKVKEILASHDEYKEAFEAVPFNSGYFMCLKLKGADPEETRQLLLDEFDTGLIAAAGLLRVAFSAAPYDQLEALFDNVYQAVLRLQK